MNEPNLYQLLMEQAPRLQFDFLFHNPNPAIDDYLHDDHTHTDEDGNEVTSPGTPDRPVVIETEPDPDPDPPNANPGPAPNPDPNPQQGGDGMIEPLTKAKLDALTLPASVPTGGVFRGGTDDEFIFDGKLDSSSNLHIHSVYSFAGRPNLLAIYGVNAREDEHGNAFASGEDEQLYGGGGNDVLVGGEGDDYLDGGPGNDYLFGGVLRVSDSVYGGGDEASAVNILMGGPGNDYLESAGMSNILNGGPGNDHLVSSGSEHVAMIGGPGNDLFDVFSTDGKVKIMDFQDGADKIRLTEGAFDPAGHKALYQLAVKAGVQWDMGWIATEVDNGVTLQVSGDAEEQLTIEGAYLANLQFELVNGDLFIV